MLVVAPAFNDLIRHPRLLPMIESLFNGRACFGEIGLRRMPPYRGRHRQHWHRDRRHWLSTPCAWTTCSSWST